MDHDTHVFLVNTHTECIGGADDPDGVAKKIILDVLLERGCQSGMKGSGLKPLLLEKFSQLFAVSAGGAVDNASTVLQPFFQQLLHSAVLAGSAHFLDFKAQVFPLNSGFKQDKLQTKLIPEIVQDFVAHIFLGSGRETLYRRDVVLLYPSLFLAEFTDEAGSVQVVSAKIMTPLGQTVGLVKDPATDLALRDGGSKGTVAKLFRRHIENACVPHANHAQNFTTLGRGEHAVQGNSRRGAGATAEAVHLVLHQGLQGRDDNGKQAAPLVPYQGRQLKAERFAAAGGQDGQQRTISHGAFHRGLLQTGSVIAGWGRPEGIKAEKSLQLTGWIMGLLAPGTSRVTAGDITQDAENSGNLGKPVQNPGRQHRAASCHLQPGQTVGQGQAGVRLC